MQTAVLKDDFQKVATNPKVYKNRKYFDKNILTQLDTTVIYEEYNTNNYEGLNKLPDILERFNYRNSNDIYLVYRFYGNGCYNLFYLYKNKPELTKEMFDPLIRGSRGVIYSKKSKTKGDLITQVSGIGTYEKLTELFEIKGDTLVVLTKSSNIKKVYVKRIIPAELLKFTADW